MQTLLAFAAIVLLLGLFFGLPYHAAYKRRLALAEQDSDHAEEKKARTTLDKSPSSS